MCVDLIRNAVENGHKILVFSQFTTMLSRLADRLENEETAYYMLTGSTGKEKRAKLVEEFNKEDNPTAVFLISPESRRNRSESDGSGYCDPL